LRRRSNMPRARFAGVVAHAVLCPPSHTTRIAIPDDHFWMSSEFLAVCGKTPKSAAGSLEGARLQPRRSSFSVAYGTAKAVPFQNFGSRRVFPQPLESRALSKLRRQEFFRKLLVSSFENSHTLISESVDCRQSNNLEFPGEILWQRQ